MPNAQLLPPLPRQTVTAAAAPWALPVLILALAAAMAWQDQTVPASLMGAAGGGLVGALLTRRRLADAALRLRHDMVAGGAGGDGAGLGGETAAGPGGITGPRGLATAPELAPLAEGLCRLLARQHSLLEAQAGQLESLREQAHGDALTGLPNRRHFMATLDAFLSGDAGPVDAGLVLVRLRDLQGMNDRIGHTATDHVLQALGQTLQSYPERIRRCVAGRLNGADFALLLPVGGLAAETAASLIQALRLPLAQIDPAASVAAGVVELQGQLSATQALALADAALARAESHAGGLVVDTLGACDIQAVEATLGHESWQRRIGRALAEGRVALGAYPVRTADGRQLHLDCPLRVQLAPDGPLEPASRWLAQATRSRLCADVDDSALGLALQAIAEDGLARCVNIAAQSVGESDFIAAVSRRLEAAPEAACRLWIDLPETLALERPMLVRELSRRWRPLGVMLGLEHAGEGLARIPRLIELGLDCVRIDSRFVNHITGPEAEGARRYLKGLVSLVQSMGLQVCAEGVRSADDLELLWAMGFDAATGPALVADLAPAD